jgi:hypothetical protein
MPLLPKKGKVLLEWRKRLLQRQTIKSWSSIKRREAGVLSRGSAKFPNVVVDPDRPFIDPRQVFHV